MSNPFRASGWNLSTGVGSLWGSFDHLFRMLVLPPTGVNRTIPTRTRLAAMRRVPEVEPLGRVRLPVRPRLPEGVEYRVADVSQTLEAMEIEWPREFRIPPASRRVHAV